MQSADQPKEYPFFHTLLNKSDRSLTNKAPKSLETEESSRATFKDILKSRKVKNTNIQMNISKTEKGSTLVSRNSSVKKSKPAFYLCDLNASRQIDISDTAKSRLLRAMEQMKIDHMKAYEQWQSKKVARS